MSYQVTLRKLTFKSLLKNGRHADKTVQQVIDTGYRGIKDLQGTYFRMSRITFVDEVLDELEIPEEYRIEKPGKDQDRLGEFSHYLYEKRGKEMKEMSETEAITEKKKIKYLNRQGFIAQKASFIAQGRNRKNQAFNNRNRPPTE